MGHSLPTSPVAGGAAGQFGFASAQMFALRSPGHRSTACAAVAQARKKVTASAQAVLAASVGRGPERVMWRLLGCRDQTELRPLRGRSRDGRPARGGGSSLPRRRVARKNAFASVAIGSDRDLARARVAAPGEE